MPKIFNPGAFRHKITFLMPSTEKSPCGEPTDDWRLFKTVKASKEPLIGKELYVALTNETQIEVKFRMRYTAGITDRMRIQHGCEIYKIISAVDVNAAHKELVCYCRLVK